MTDRCWPGLSAGIGSIVAPMWPQVGSGPGVAGTQHGRTRGYLSDQGPRHDLITQHYGILKSEIVIVVDLAAASVVGRHGGSGEHGDFPGCLHSLALGRVRNAIEWTSAPGWDSELVEED